MYGMPERINSDDIRMLNDFFTGKQTDAEQFEILKKKIELLTKQDDISRDAGQKITDLQDQIVALYRKDVEPNVEEKEEK